MQHYHAIDGVRRLPRLLQISISAEQVTQCRGLHTSLQDAWRTSLKS